MHSEGLPPLDEEPFSGSRRRSRLAAAILHRDLTPWSRGAQGLALLAILIAAHILIATIGTDSGGFIFRGGVVRESLGLSFLLVGPALATYAGARGVFDDREAPLPYLAVSGGLFLTLLTLAGWALAAL